MCWFGPELGWMDLSKQYKQFLVVDEMNRHDSFI
jgi:hypothetical protein